jgi:hypothetical protein
VGYRIARGISDVRSVWRGNGRGRCVRAGAGTDGGAELNYVGGLASNHCVEARRLASIAPNAARYVLSCLALARQITVRRVRGYGALQAVSRSDGLS